MTRPLLANRDARRLFLDRHLLLRPGSGPGKGADLAGLLGGLGFVQVDSVNTLARSHDLILWSRRGRYRPRALQDMVARHRTAFEHWTHDAAVVPMPYYPMWRLKFARDEARMQQRWPKWQREGWDSELDTVLRRIADHGPASSQDVGEGEERGSTGWWDWHPSKTALEYLWRSGRLAICRREGVRKFYDLSERVIPAEHLTASREDAEIIDWAMTAALDRLGFGTNPNLEQPLETRGVRLLSRVGRLPAPMVSKLVEKYTLQEMFGSSVSHLMEIDGIGPRRARQIRAALLRITESSGR